MLHTIVKYAALLITIKGVCSDSSSPSAELSRCTIPNTPELKNMKFSLLFQNQSLKLDSFVEDYGVIHIECKRRHILNGPSNLICKHGEWDKKFPICETYCSGTFWKRLSLKAVCDQDLNFFPCPERIDPGTNINMVCAFGYIREPNRPQILKCLPNGGFDKKPRSCKQDCGKISTFAKTLTKATIPTNEKIVPWHVSVYEIKGFKNVFMCSGSIVSPRIIITAAHCFWDEQNSRITNKEYQIIAGQSTKAFSDIENEQAQLVRVEQTYIPEDYKGNDGKQKHDIAFLKLSTPLKYSTTVAPICIPEALLNEVPAHVIVSNAVGYINSFSQTNDLKAHQMTILTNQDCLANLPEYAVVADDKFCVHSNESRVLCKGDSGAGFYTNHLDPETNEVTYRLLGVASNFPASNDDCIDDKSFAAMTSILQIPTEFRRKLTHAREEDEALF